jgi:Carboxypeptidase regulatory-like domain
MRLEVSALLVAFALSISAENPADSTSTRAKASSPRAATSWDALLKDLPVRRVVLYKSGVGYFEHAGSVTGSERVAIDFTSPQLNDVLQSLTVLDEGGGRIAGVDYNSTTPLAEQLKTLSLGMTENATSTELFGALRGQRVEVSGAPGGSITGRLMSIESRTEKTGSGDSGDTTIDKFYLTIVGASGEVRVVELTPSLSVRPLDAALQSQLDRYLELISTAHFAGLRHLLLDAVGQGQRELRVSYISEIPVWKSTYRIVFPRQPDGKVIVQGWAVVDNTVGADWDNVQLSLVAGAPQSFIQPLSQPLYTRRPEIPIATNVETTPQTHEAAEGVVPGAISGTIRDPTGAAIADATVTVTAEGTNAVLTGRTSSDGSFAIASLAPGYYTLTVMANGFQRFIERGITVSEHAAATVNATLQVGTANETVEVEASSVAKAAPGAPPPPPAEISHNFLHGIGSGSGNGAGFAGGVGGGVYRPSDAISAGDVSTNAFDDFFEYALAQPVTIHKNESAMVPILQQELPAEHVTLWSERGGNPLRAVWLDNQSKLTLDSGSFSVFESGEFAGEGLLDPIHPGERRLLSYAADQAVKMKVVDRTGDQRLSHLHIVKGAIVEMWMNVAGVTYSANNTGDEDRTVLIEHPRHTATGGWTLDGELKAAEETPNLYRFRLQVPAHSTQKLEVRERGPEYTTVDLSQNPRQQEFLLDLVKRVPDAQTKLQPVIDAEAALTALDEKIADQKKTEETATADEARDRENLTALKGNEAARRFVDELNRAEDQLQATRKQIADLEQQQSAATMKLYDVINSLSFDWSETVK